MNIPRGAGMNIDKALADRLEWEFYSVFGTVGYDPPPQFVERLVKLTLEQMVESVLQIADLGINTSINTALTLTQSAVGRFRPEVEKTWRDAPPPWLETTP